VRYVVSLRRVAGGIKQLFPTAHGAAVSDLDSDDGSDYGSEYDVFDELGQTDVRC